MTYIEGFVAAVPRANKEAYRRHAAEAYPLFEEFGATRMVEAWADDVPEGKVTDFRRAVQARDDEDVVFSWVEYPDKATRDSANARMRSDPRMEQVGAAMPFDGKRMIYGGFEPVIDEGSGSGAYVDGFVVPVFEDKLDAYRDMSARMAGVFRQHGALRGVEARADDVPEGKVTDFRRSVKAEDGDRVFFSFIEWPDKATRDAAWQAIMSDESLKPEGEMPFDGQRMFWGGFQPILDTANAQATQSARASEPA